MLLSTLLPRSRRLAGIAHHTVRLAVRQKLGPGLVLLVAASVLAAPLLRGLNFGSSELRFVANLGTGLCFLCGALLTLAATIQLHFAEIEQRTVLLLLARPVRPAELIWGQWAGVSVLLGVFSLVATSVLALTLEARAAELTAHGVALPAPLPALGHWIVFGLLLWLQCALLSAVVLLIASLTESALLTTLLAGLIWLAGQFQPVAREIYAQADSAWWRFGVRALAGIIPNLRLLPETELATRETGAWLAALSRATPYALGYIGVAGSLAAWRFRHREF